ncbi:50S ribosomal protein L24 [Candidatus Woesearchaeota archaeon]|nr:50S ribosomal protein L24 [Candidatus Woesearchaeota archaeon]
MKKEFSTSWIGSKQPRKQRKYRYNAPLHIKSQFLNVHLSKELRAKYKRRCLRIRKGDKVIILRGDHRKHAGRVELVNVKKSYVFVEKVEQTRKDGSTSLRQLEPSNLMIIELDTSDKKRMKKLTKGKEQSKEQNKEQNKPAQKKK